MFTTLANIANFSSAIMALAYGVQYLVRQKFLMYHRSTVDKRWSDLSAEMKAMILGLMRAVGGGMIAGGATTFYLQFYFNKYKQAWIALAILICASVVTLGIIYAHLTVMKSTKGRPPLVAAIAVLLLLIAGYFLNIAALSEVSE